VNGAAPPTTIDRSATSVASLAGSGTTSLAHAWDFNVAWGRRESLACGEAIANVIADWFLAVFQVKKGSERERNMRRSTARKAPFARRHRRRR
jgi:hypothetical protein